MVDFQQGFLGCLQYFVVKRRHRTMTSKSRRRIPYLNPKKLFSIKINKIPVIVFKEGHIVIGTDNIDTAVNVMNFIKYNLLFMGYRHSYAIKFTDLIQVGYKMNFDYDFSQLEDNDPCTSHTCCGVLEQHLKKAILKTGEIMKKNPEIVEQFRLLSESQIHLDNVEFSASFLLSYLILERRVYTKWDSKIRSLHISNDRKSQFLQHRMWSTSRVLEVGNLINIFDKNQYELLDKFRKIRNMLAHEGTHVTERDAHHCFDLAEKVIFDEIQKIKIKDIDKITWR